MTEKAGRAIGRSELMIPGAKIENNGCRFTAVLPDGPAELCIYEEGDTLPSSVIPVSQEERTGRLAAVFFEHPHPEKLKYIWRLKDRYLPDPYAVSVEWLETPEGSRIPLAGTCAGEGAPSRPLQIPFETCIFYKAHVKGFTAGKGSRVKHPGTFAGVAEKIPHLKELGVTSLILMPVYEFRVKKDTPATYRIGGGLSVKRVGADEKENYWGYADGFYFAPKRSYASSEDPCAEFARMVRKLHEAGIECITEFWFRPDEDPRFVTDVLRFYRLHYGLDGFRLIGYGGYLTSVVHDPLLADCKLLSEGFDLRDPRPFGFCRQTGTLNLEYEHLMRRFLKGDADLDMEQVRRMLHRTDSNTSFIDYLVDHDGFTLYDMTAYGDKHNEENGEAGRDGTNENYSWNCGAEGETRSAAVRAQRRRQLRNACLLLMTSQAPPMLYGGDEVLNSQGGNNNAWCQDNETGWITWGTKSTCREMLCFVQECIAFRKAHPVLFKAEKFRMTDHKGTGIPDLSYHSKSAWTLSRETVCGLGVMICGDYAGQSEGTTDETLYIAYNMYWKPQEFALPALPGKKTWTVAAHTGAAHCFDVTEEEAAALQREGKMITVPERTILILAGR